jgi:UDP-glucose 4-epimerase
MSYNRVLVTGGAGFIGSHLVDELVRHGFLVSVLDNLSTGKASNLNGAVETGKVNLVKGDIRNKGDIKDAMRGVDAVFHLAAISSVPFSEENPKVVREVNVGGTSNLLEACLSRDVSRFIYVSSCAVYGNPEYLPVDEKHPLHPISVYAKSKLEAEKVCMEFHKVYRLKTTIMRPFNVYGPRQRKDQYAGVIALFIERLLEKKPPLIFGDGLQTRDFIHVSDVIKALVLALERDVSVGQVFNVASGVPTSINDLARLAIELSGVESFEPAYVEERKGDIRDIYADISNVSSFLGLKPQVSLGDGFSRLL